MSDHQEVREDWHMEIGVSFRHNPKIYSFVATGIRLSIGDKVLVRTEKGVDMGEVMELKGRIDPERAAELMPVVRKATKEDLEHIAEQEQRERQALDICAEAIERHGLPMKLIDASLSFDNTRLVFFFSADGRVDFRELVRDLARTFRMRIELRQIGVRDQAKLLGGLGPCGRRLCCKTFMREFEPVGIRVAKDQGLALNPNKISGLCDRLMCCLLFEHETYCALRERLPARGDRVLTRQGPGTVKEVALLKEELTIVLDDGMEVRARACEVTPLDNETEAEVPPPAPPAPEEVAVEEDNVVEVSEQPSPGEEEPSRSRRRRSRRKRRKPRGERSSEGQERQQGQNQAAEAKPDQWGEAKGQEKKEQSGSGGLNKRRSSRKRRGRRSRRKGGKQESDNNSRKKGDKQPEKDGGST